LSDQLSPGATCLPASNSDMNSEAISVETTEDALLAGHIRLRQPKDGFRAAIDSVLLPAAVTAVANDRVFEIGAGCGAATLCLARRVDGVKISGIEVQPHLVRLAGNNVRANGFEQRIDIMAGDVAQPLPPRVQGPFDHVMMNPPYLEASRSRLPDHSNKATAHIEGAAGLEIWISRAHSLLRHKGIVTLIHRADRLDDIIRALGGKFGGITVYPLWPRSGAPAKRVIVRARKGVATPFALTSGLVLHADNGDYTAAAESILRGGPLTF
jgi:tRNA1(Val) A37 N6-methylase TrmN6